VGVVRCPSRGGSAELGMQLTFKLRKGMQGTLIYKGFGSRSRQQCRSYANSIALANKVSTIRCKPFRSCELSGHIEPSCRPRSTVDRFQNHEGLLLLQSAKADNLDLNHFSAFIKLADFEGSIRCFDTCSNILRVPEETDLSYRHKHS
jgi:hypothetical protein